MAISLYELAQRVNSAMPLGTIVPYYGTDEPSGWKICDGRSCAGTDLAKKLGISVVPDLRGRFIRMIGGNAAGMAVAQGDLVGNHTHTIPLWGGGGRTEPNSVCCWDNNFRNGEYKATLSGAVENRPINMAFNYIIKVVGTNVILYYVSNIIYKAKAHICRTFSFVKSFQREVRNSMSISLKNHEDRIVSLEGKSSMGLGVKEYTTGNPGYILFNNGLCIQYGRNNFYASRNSNVSFAKTFSSILGSGHFCNTTNDRRPWECSSRYRNLTNSGFIIDQSGHDFVGVMYWIFIGTLTI